jgi:hypothetical protein
MVVPYDESTMTDARIDKTANKTMATATGQSQLRKGRSRTI